MKVKHKIQTILSKYGLSFEDEVSTSVSEKQLEDGTTIYSDGGFAEGSSVYVVNEEGEQIPVPTGEYTCTDGTTIQVEDGTVASGEATEDTEEAPEAPSEDENTEEMAEGQEEPLEEDEETMSEDEDEEEMMSKFARVLRKVDSKHSAEVKSLKSEIRRLKTELSKDAGRISRTRNASAQPPAPAKHDPKQSRVYEIFNTYR